MRGYQRDRLPVWRGAVSGKMYSATQTRALDRCAIVEAGIAGFTLMSLAARASFRVLKRAWPHAVDVVVVCGGGNNGGDGYLVAANAAQSGMSVSCFSLVAPEKLTGDARQAYDWAIEKGVKPQCWRGEQAEREKIRQADVVVDALLGTGLNGPVREPFTSVIECINFNPNVLAVDIPSGLCADTGQLLGTCVRARHTVTFIGAKVGLFTGLGPDVVGEVHFDGLQLPENVYAEVPYEAQILPFESLVALLPQRRPSAHKGDFGRVLLIGGETGMAGAILLAASACLRTGAGLVVAATRAQHSGYLVPARPEVMFQAVEDARSLEELIKWADVVVVGPGMGTGAWGRGMLETLMGYMVTQVRGQRLVVDADALNLIAQDPGLRPRDGVEWVMTPHPGEAARLLGVPVTEVNANRLVAARTLANRYGASVALKGAGTVLAFGGDDLWINPTGNPGMASAGMGDVLSGMLGSLLAQKLPIKEAVLSGVALHGWAGDIACEVRGQAGLLAMDLVETLPKIWVELEERKNESANQPVSPG